MPLSINVGLSRKASRDYQSTGVSINVTAELDTNRSWPDPTSFNGRSAAFIPKPRTR